MNHVSPAAFSKLLFDEDLTPLRLLHRLDELWFGWVSRPDPNPMPRFQLWRWWK